MLAGSSIVISVALAGSGDEVVAEERERWAVVLELGLWG